MPREGRSPRTLSRDPALRVPADAGAPRSPPLRALVLAAAALAVPALAAGVAPDWLREDTGLLLWLTPLLPAFLLAYYKGWRGAALALAAGMASITGAHVIFLVSGVEPPSWPWMMGVVLAYLLIAQGIAALAELLHRERRAAERLAHTDALTGLPNRRDAAAFLDRAFAAAVRGQSLGVALFDLDHFKLFNDRFGHAVGDQVLQAFADILKTETRRMDLSARFGGEEFLTVLLSCSLDEAVEFAERVRAHLASLKLPWGALTVSAGVAAYRDGTGSADLLVAAADRALYRAKERGRDRVEVDRTAQEGARERARPQGTEPAEALPPLEVMHVDVPGEEGSRAPLVVVIDDDPDVERSVARMLTRLGCDVLDARSPAHVLDLFGEFGDRIALLVTDVIMPGMNGLTLVERLAKRGHVVRVIYMSGYVHGEVTLPGIPGAVSGFLGKPIEMAALAQEVGRVLGTPLSPAEDERRLDKGLGPERASEDAPLTYTGPIAPA